MTLGDGLLFHDGTRVLARDCVASLRRWMRRDPIGQTIAGRLDALEATDDRTLVWRLNKPFASLPYALAKTQPTPVIMPERLAQTDPFKQVPEVIGSGPFRYVPGEYVSGHSAVFARFDRYSPRDEAASFTAGGYRVLVDRVEWRIMPDPGDRGQRVDEQRGGLARFAAAGPAAAAEGASRHRRGANRPVRHAWRAAAPITCRAPRPIRGCGARCWRRSTRWT